MTQRTPFLPQPGLPQPGVNRRRVLLRVAAAAAGVGCGLPVLAARTLKIGCTLDSTGVEKANGNALTLGATAYFNAVNQAGGVGGASIEMSVLDDQFKPELTKKNALTFGADPQVLAMLHPLGTRQTLALMETVPDIAVVGPNTGNTGLHKKGASNVFWVRANYDQEMEKLVATATTLGMRKIALVHPNDPLGQSLLAAFNTVMAAYQVQPAVIATTPGTTSPEVEPAALEIAKAQPQLVIMGLAGTAPKFMRALRAAGCTSTVYGLSIGASASNIKELGDTSRGLGFSIVVPSPFSPKYEIVRRYQADMQAAGNTEYSLPSLEGYINARVLVEGLRRAGANPTRESVKSGLESLDRLDLGGLRISYSKSRHEGSNFVDVAVIGANQRLIS